MAVYWELKERDPVVDLSLLKDRNFGVSAFLMFMVGVVLLGSTVLIPQYLQLVMGYSATQAGLAISPGGLLVMGMLPFVGFLLSKVEARWLIGVGLVITSLALIHMTNFDIYMDFRYAVYRALLSSGGAGVSVCAHQHRRLRVCAAEQEQCRFGLINLARNVGGSLGISLVTTILARRSQFHQPRLTEHITPLNPAISTTLSIRQRTYLGPGSGATARTR